MTERMSRVPIEQQREKLDAAVQTVVDKMEVNYDTFDVTLTCGSKKLVLHGMNSEQFSTTIQNVSDGRNRIDGETTVLYLAARNIMKKIVQQDRMPKKYVFYTHYTKLVQWANTIGDDIFHWEQKDFTEKDEEMLIQPAVFSTTIYEESDPKR